MEPSPAALSYRTERHELANQVRSLLIDALQLELEPGDIGLDSPLFGSGLGLDSVDALGIAASIEQSMGIEVLDTDIGLFRSTNTIVDFIQERRLAATAPPTSGGEAADIVEEPPADPVAFPLDHPDFAYHRLRQASGVIDYSHVEKIRVAGPGAMEFMDREAAGNVADLPVNGLLQTVLLEDSGSIAAVVWLLRDESGYIVMGQEGAKQDLLRLLLERSPGYHVTVEDSSEAHGLFSVTGPRSQENVVDFLGQDLLRLSYCEFMPVSWSGHRILVCRYGDTGEYDYRFLVESGAAADLLDAYVSSTGTPLLGRAGVDASPVLALEMKSMRTEFLAPDCLPTQVDLHWMVLFRKEQFRGREALLTRRKEPRRVAIIATGPDDSGTASAGDPVLCEGEPVGFLQTSARSPHLGRTVHLVYLDPPFGCPGLTFGIRSTRGPEITITSCSAPLFVTRTVLDNLNL